MTTGGVPRRGTPEKREKERREIRSVSVWEEERKRRRVMTQEEEEHDGKIYTEKCKAT